MFKRFFGLMVVGFLAFSLFGAVRSSAYQAGWSQGFNSGQIAALQQAPAESAEAETAAPAAAPQAQPRAHYGHHGYYGHGFAPFWWFFGGLLRFFFILFLLSFIFKFIGFAMWRSGRWHRHGRRGSWRHGHHGPPWARHYKGRGRRRRRDYDDDDEQDTRSDKERHYDEYGPDSPIVDL